MPDTPRDFVAHFWTVMGGNDFTAASLLLSEDFEYYMPQTGEYLTGRANFAGLNATYPAQGPWRFDLRRIVAEGREVVTEVGVTDGAVKAVALTFHTLRDGVIWRQVEYWPDPYPAPANRARWVSQVKSAPF
ncbi:nuclear transport factor 2 family protein [Marimonas sp. MJW-29]|uniref:Nuclear transport factor 2 family protein n=1 Tax=Sulfitobacter sediminis TaxID=3234186 RepID=A0ABV3RQA8_9RHOB